MKQKHFINDWLYNPLIKRVKIAVKLFVLFVTVQSSCQLHEDQPYQITITAKKHKDAVSKTANYFNPHESTPK